MRRASGDGIPIALKDVIGTKGVETTAGSKILAGYVPVYDSTVAARCKARGPAAAREDEHRRVRDGLVDRELGVRAFAEPVGPDAGAGRVGRRLGGGGRRPGSRRGRSAPTPAARSSSRPRSAATSGCGRPTGRSRRYGIVAFASSLDQVGPVTKTVRDCAFLYSVIAGRDPADSTTVDVPAVEMPGGASDLKGLRVGVPVEMRDAAGIEPGVAEAVARAIALCEELGAEVEECSLPRSVEYGLPCYYLIAPAEASSNLARYDGVRYGFRADGDDLTDGLRAHARRGLRRRAEAPDHARHLRALGRLLRRVLRQGAAGADDDHPRARRRLRALRPDRLGDVADGRVPDRRARATTRSRCTPATC